MVPGLVTSSSQDTHISYPLDLNQLPSCYEATLSHQAYKTSRKESANVLMMPFTETGNAFSSPLMEESIYCPDETSTARLSFTDQLGLAPRQRRQQPRRTVLSG